MDLDSKLLREKVQKALVGIYQILIHRIQSWCIRYQIVKVGCLPKTIRYHRKTILVTGHKDLLHLAF